MNTGVQRRVEVFTCANTRRIHFIDNAAGADEMNNTKNIAFYMARGADAFAAKKPVSMSKPRSWQENAIQIGYAMAKAAAQG